ncbi:MAG: hypothetical protein ACLT3H_02755 [Roseburia sp.]
MARTKAAGESMPYTIETQARKEDNATEKYLIAVLPILFESHQYEAGDSLPAHNHEMLELWIKAGSAKWVKRSSGEVKNDDV